MRTEQAIDPGLVEAIVRLDHAAGRFTERISLLAGMSINDVLFAGSQILGSAGTLELPFRVPFASVTVSSAAGLTLHASTLGLGAPPQGRGVKQLAGGQFATFNLAGTVLSLYGLPGQLVQLDVFAKPVPPTIDYAWGQIARQNLESVAPLIANATFAGAALDSGANAVAGAGFSRVRAFASADVAGQLSVQQARLAAGPWFTTSGPTAITPGFANGTVIDNLLALRFCRVFYTNGAVGQASFELDSCLVAT